MLNGVASYEIDPPGLDEMRARFAAITSARYPYIVAIDEDGTILGYAYASAFRTRPAYRWLVEDSIYLAPEARGRGIGGALLATRTGIASADAVRRGEWGTMAGLRGDRIEMVPLAEAIGRLKAVPGERYAEVRLSFG